MSRTDSATRVVAAAPEAVYAALVDADAVARFLPPGGMTAHVEMFDPTPGGALRIVLAYLDDDHPARAKSDVDSDVVVGRFGALVPDERVEWVVTFESDDRDFAGEMTMAWSLRAVPDGTRVTITATDVPVGIAADEHAQGMAETLGNLAALLAD